MGQIIEFTDLSAPELDVYARLTNGQLRSKQHQERGIFIAENHKVVSHALDAGYEPISFLMEGRQITGVAADLLRRCPDTPTYTAPPEVLEQLTGYRMSRGILCAMRRKPLPTPEAVCKDARRIAVLEGIVDPTNIGAIFRSAAALGMDGILLTPTCCDPLYRRSVRVSMGTVFQIPWTYLDSHHSPWPDPGLRQLSDMGFQTAALALTQRSVSIDDPILARQEKLALLFGTEGDGLSQETIDLCDFTVKIPMANGVDSLNVAAASAVAFWQLRVRSAPY